MPVNRLLAGIFYCFLFMVHRYLRYLRNGTAIEEWALYRENNKEA